MLQQKLEMYNKNQRAELGKMFTLQCQEYI